MVTVPENLCKHVLIKILGLKHLKICSSITYIDEFCILYLKAATKQLCD